MKKYYLSLDSNDKLAWLGNFSRKLPLYKAKYGLTDAEVEEMEKAFLFLLWVFEVKNLTKEFSARVTAYRKEMMKGAMHGTVASIIPNDFVLPPNPAVVEPNIFGRAIALVNKIKNHPDFTEADGKDLGVIGSEKTPEETDKKAQFTVRYEGGKVIIEFIKGDATSVEVHVDRGTGKFELLTIATNSPIIDEYVLPEGVKSVVFRYRAIRRIKDKRVGDWSDIIEIALR